MSKTLIIFEFKNEIRSFLSQRTINDLKGENTYILALLPESQAYLKQLQVPYSNTGGLFSKEGHEGILSQSEKIYRFCEPFLKIEDDLGIKEGYKISLLAYMRFYVHYILWLITVIGRACEKWDIRKIITCRRDNRYLMTPMLSAGEGHTADIGERIAKRDEIGFESFPDITAPKDSLFYKRVKRSLINIARLLVFKLNFSSMGTGADKFRTILTTSRSYGLDKVIGRFRKRRDNFRTVYLSDKSISYFKRVFSLNSPEGHLPLPTVMYGERRLVFSNKMKESVSEIERSTDPDGIFEYERVGFKDLVFGKVRKDILPALCDIYTQGIYLEKFLKRHTPSLIVSQMSRDINYNLGELSGLHNIPSLLISHGSHVPPKNKYEMMEWSKHGLGLMNTRYSHLAVQTPWALRYLEKVPTTSCLIKTGPLFFAGTEPCRKSELRKKIIPAFSDKIIILHAGTPKSRHAIRPYVYETVDEYINNINLLIKEVEKIREMHLIVRFRPGASISLEDFSSLLVKSDSYSIHSKGAFSDYLCISDLLVSYSSTTIEEALLNKLPVLLFDPQGKYCHIEDAALLTPSANTAVDSCYYVDKYENLTWALKWLLENHFSGPVPDSVWTRHTFNDSETVDVSSYFEKYLNDRTAASV